MGFGKKIRKEIVRQEGDILSEETKDDSIHKAGHWRGLEAATTEGERHFAETGGCLLGDGPAGGSGPKFVRSMKQIAENLQVARLRQRGQFDEVNFFRSGGEVGVNDDAVEIADREKGGIFQRFPIEQDLRAGLIQILVTALVFDGEEAPLPDVGKAVAAAGFPGPALEGEPFALWIRLCRSGVSGECAKIKKMLLGGTSFSQGHPGPFLHEGIGGS